MKLNVITDMMKKYVKNAKSNLATNTLCQE